MRGPPKVHRDRDAGETPAARPDEERHGSRHLLRLEQPLDRVRFEDHLLEHALYWHAACLRLVGELRLHERRANKARADGRGQDSLVGSLQRKRLDQAEDAVLGRLGGLER
jgi:hypothetical protein